MNKFSFNGKTIAAVGSAVLVLLVLVFTPVFIGQGYKNRAISLEEQVSADLSNISVVIQKRVDQLTQLVNVIQDSKEFESGVLIQVTAARAQAEAGDIEQSNITLNAVAEAYPEIKTIGLYENLMNATSTVENQLSGARIAYNSDVQSYNKLIRQFPNSFFLDMAGYNKQSYRMFVANDSANDYNPAEDNLFGNE